ncbi:MAG: aminoacyl-tRNA hydrolase [Candidatus Hydrogenedentes bacterium]|nr:aminoacyl-tRNA hydrolase [Candidatus Hydrogenedentota bacterium]
MKLIVGLGNPGPTYRDTRHNAGFRVLDCLAERLCASFSKEKYHALVAETSYEGHRLVMMKPLTFMNKSGLAVARALRYTTVDLADVLVVVDDVNLPLGRLRLRGSGSAGGHNGLKSIIAHLNSEEFPRLRLGVGRAGHSADTVNHVLSSFAAAERPQVNEMVERATEAVMSFVTNGLERAMNTFN